MKKVIILIIALVLLTGCAKGNTNPYEGRDTVSPLGLEGVFVDTSVKEIKELIDSGETFIFLAGFENCPSCQAFVPILHKVAVEKGVKIGYLDTRKDPEWKSNLDVTDYDILAEILADYLTLDEDGIPHLYVPDCYFVKNGEIIARAQSSDYSEEAVIKFLEIAIDSLNE